MKKIYRIMTASISLIWSPINSATAALPQQSSSRAQVGIPNEDISSQQSIPTSKVAACQKQKDNKPIDCPLSNSLSRSRSIDRTKKSSDPRNWISMIGF